MDYKDVAARRRAVNFFDTGRDVPESLLREMVDLAALAPSGFNLQPWNLVVLRKPEEKARLQKLAWNQPKVSEAPVTLIVLADKTAWQEDSPNWRSVWNDMNLPPEKRDWFAGACKSLYAWSPEATLAFAVKNTGFFAMSLMYAATALGLDSHPMDGFDHEAVRKEFSIPDTYWIPVLLAVGYLRPGTQIAPPKRRRGYDEIVVRFGQD